MNLNVNIYEFSSKKNLTNFKIALCSLAILSRLHFTADELWVSVTYWDTKPLNCSNTISHYIIIFSILDYLCIKLN